MTPSLPSQQPVAMAPADFITQFGSAAAAIQAITAQSAASALQQFRSLPGLTGSITITDWASLESTQGSIPHTGDGTTPTKIAASLHNAIQAAIAGQDTSTLLADLLLFYIACRPR